MENTEHLVQRDIEILRRAQSLGANPDFFVVFAVAVLVAVTGIVCVLAMGMWGMIIFAVLAAAVALDHFTGIGDKALIITLVVSSGLLGLLTLAVAVYVWTAGGGG